MRPEKDWAEKAVEEIMLACYGQSEHPGITLKSYFSYPDCFKRYAVETIKRHAASTVNLGRPEAIYIAPVNRRKRKS